MNIGFFNWFKKQKITDCDIRKVFIVSLTHPHFRRLAVLASADKVFHFVHNGHDWLYVDVEALTPSPSGLLNIDDVRYDMPIWGAGDFLSNSAQSRATLRTVEYDGLTELQIVGIART